MARPMAGSSPAVAAGMVGSTQGWVEAPYVRCPAELGNLAVLTEVRKSATSTSFLA